MSKSARAPLGWLTAAAARMCPACGAPDLLPGPRGGESQNFYCTKCRQGWNVFEHPMMGTIDVDPLGIVGDALIEFYLGVAAGEELRRSQLKADGWSNLEIDRELSAQRFKLPKPDMARMIRETLKGDGFTEQEIDEVFHFAQIVEPSGNVVRVADGNLTELRGIMHRLFRGKRDES